MDADLFLLVLEHLIKQHGSRRINQSVIDRIVQLGGEIEKLYSECEPRNYNDPVPEDRREKEKTDGD